MAPIGRSPDGAKGWCVNQGELVEGELWRIDEPRDAIVMQLAFSGAQVLLALVAWMSILSGLEGVFHAHDCWCGDEAEISGPARLAAHGERVQPAALRSA